MFGSLFLIDTIYKGDTGYKANYNRIHTVDAHKSLRMLTALNSHYL